MNKTTAANNLSHKGYTGSIDVSIEDNCLHGKILFIDDIVTYEADNVSGILTAFTEAVDRYVAYCKESGTPANKPYSGTFNVRIGSALHRKAAITAFHNRITLNDFVTQSIEAAIDQKWITPSDDVAQTVKTILEKIADMRVEHTHYHITDSKGLTTLFAPVGKPLAWEELNAARC